MRLKNLKLPIKHDGCHDAGCQVGKQLAGKGQEDSLGCHSDTLEKVGSNHLKTDNGEKHDYDTQSGGRALNQSFVGGKGGYSQFGHQFAYKESAGGDKGGSVDSQF